MIMEMILRLFLFLFLVALISLALVVLSVISVKSSVELLAQMFLSVVIRLLFITLPKSAMRCGREVWGWRLERGVVLFDFHYKSQWLGPLPDT
jgi:hypothetical protein